MLCLRDIGEHILTRSPLPLLYSRSQLHALLSSRIHTISSQTRNRCSMQPFDKPVTETQRKWHCWAWLGGPTHSQNTKTTAENTISMHNVHKKKEFDCSQRSQKNKCELPFKQLSRVPSHPSLSLQPAHRTETDAHSLSLIVCLLCFTG